MVPSDANGWQAALTHLSRLDLFVAGLATFVSLAGLMLPRFGNFIGRLVLGEDPLLQRWQAARTARRAQLAAAKAAKKSARQGKKAGKEPPPA